MAYSLGIDLGTTYTAAAVARDDRAEVVTLGYRATSVPTVVVLTEDGTFVVGDPAERHATTNPERLAREFKRRVGDTTPLLLGGTPVSVDRLLAEVIGLVHRSVSQTEGAPPASTVVTHPANWGPFKRDVLEQALRLAAVEGAGLLTEPVAAATWYARPSGWRPGRRSGSTTSAAARSTRWSWRWAATARSPCGATPRASSAWAVSTSTPR